MRKFTAPRMAALAVAATLLGLWLSGRFAAWMLGQEAGGGLGLYLHYVQASRLPEWQPFAARIWIAGALGFALPLLAWGVAMWLRWPRRSVQGPRIRVAGPRDAAAITDETGLLIGRLGRSEWRVHGPVLWASPPDTAPDIAIDNLLAADTSAIALDIGGRRFERTSGWRQARGQQVYRFDPWAEERRSHGWNPLAELPAEPSLRLAHLKDIAATLYPDRKEDERFWSSHARNAFVALVLHAFESAPPDETPTLGSVAHLAVHHASRATFQQLHDALPHGHDGRRAFAVLLAQDEGALGAIAARLAGPLRPFLGPALLAATSRHDIRLGTFAQRPATLYLTVPPQRLAEAWPLVALLFLRMEQLHAHVSDGPSCLMLMDGVTAFGRIDFYLRAMTALGNERWRWLTVVPSMDWLKRVTGETSLRAMFAAHTTCLLDAPRSPAETADRTELLAAFRQGVPASSLELQTLKPGERLLCDARLPLPLRCRTLRPRASTAAPRADIPPLPEGDPMKLSLRLAAAVASTAMSAAPSGVVLATEGAPAPAASAAKPYKWEGYSDKPVEAKLGPYRFRFPMNMYYDQMGPDFQGSTSLVLRWPTLEPYAPGENFHDTAERFISAITIHLSYLDRVPDEEYPLTLRKSIHSQSKDPVLQQDPSANLDMRIRGNPVFGLTPYYLDLPRLQDYFNRVYAPSPPVAKPDSSAHTDWYVQFAASDTPSTIIECAPKEIPDGVIFKESQVMNDSAASQRALCTHEFLVPEYKLYVRVNYLRPFLKDWQRIEARVRELLKDTQAH